MTTVDQKRKATACPGGIDFWPIQADGGGLSLSRRVPGNYGNDIINWKAVFPSPGLANP